MLFLDTSALTKLVLREVESPSLAQFIAGGDLVVSELARTELVRAVGRVQPERIAVGIALLRRVRQITLTTRLLDHAARLAPPQLRSLDAIQLASALEVREEIEAFVAYDDRLLAAASALGMPVASPGA